VTTGWERNRARNAATTFCARLEPQARPKQSPADHQHAHPGPDPSQDSIGSMPRASARLPSFFIVGPPRTGTTWVYRVLKSHANLPEQIKETRFFDHHFSKGLDWYLSHFLNAREGRPTGEVAPTYFYSAEARSRIRRLIAEARIVCTLREPVERLYSLYSLKLSRSGLRCAFDEALERDHDMRESSRYAYHLREWSKAFGPMRVMVMLYDELAEAPQVYIDKICRFVGIEPFPLLPSELKPEHASETFRLPLNEWWARAGLKGAAWLHARHLHRVLRVVKRLRLRSLFLDNGGVPVPPLDRALAQRLRERLLPEVEALEERLGVDLSSWKHGSHGR
jgi:hypothetical protein